VPELSCPSKESLDVKFCAETAREAEDLAGVFTLLSFTCREGCQKFARAVAMATDETCDNDPLSGKPRKKYSVHVVYGCEILTTEREHVRTQIAAAVAVAAAKPDQDGWYHFKDFGEFWEWVEYLPEYDPAHPPASCQPVKMKSEAGHSVPSCRGKCADRKSCYIQIEGEPNGPGWKVRCHCG